MGLGRERLLGATVSRDRRDHARRSRNCHVDGGSHVSWHPSDSCLATWANILLDGVPYSTALRPSVRGHGSRHGRKPDPGTLTARGGQCFLAKASLPWEMGCCSSRRGESNREEGQRRALLYRGSTHPLKQLHRGLTRLVPRAWLFCTEPGEGCRLVALTLARRRTMTAIH